MNNNKKLFAFKIIFSFFIFILFSYFSLTLPFDFDRDVFINLRVPRFLTLIITGFSLSTAGIILQLVTKNPLADPFIIGTSGASMLAIILSNIIGFRFYGFGYFFLILLFSVSVTIVSHRISKFSFSPSSSILLSGIALNSLVLSVIVLFVIFSRDATINFFHLSFGSFAYNDYPVIFYSLIIFLFLFSMVISMMKYISLLSFDEEKAETLGVSSEKVRIFLFLIVAFLTSVSVSISGIIGFVGLMIPHITRRLFRDEDLKTIFILNAFYGATFLLISDTVVKKFFYPMEIPPGVISAIIGSVFFIWLVFIGGKRNG